MNYILIDINIIIYKYIIDVFLSERKQSKNIAPSFTVKRTFTARNTGQLSFWVNDFYINDARCQGYGFMVLDCEGFELAPNASRKVDIA